MLLQLTSVNKNRTRVTGVYKSSQQLGHKHNTNVKAIITITFSFSLSTFSF